MLPPGTQAAITSAQITAANNAATHAAVQTSLTFYRNSAVLELADRLLGVLPESIASVLKIKSKCRQVSMSAASQRHAIERRQVYVKADGELVASRLGEALHNLRFQLLPQRRPDVFELIGFVPSADRHIVLALKLVPADKSATKQDEWWVRTAFPIGQDNFELALVRNRLLNLATGALASNKALKGRRAKRGRP